MPAAIDIVLDSLLDTAKALPFLFGAYLLLEWLAHRAGEHSRERLVRATRFGPLAGALLGLLPQCGFSIAAAGFYADRVITPGTLLAVFLSTSDEALPMLMSPEGAKSILPLVAVKFVLALTAGLAADHLFAPLWRGTWRRDSELRHHHTHFLPQTQPSSASTVLPQPQSSSASSNLAQPPRGVADEDDDHCHHSHCEGDILALALRHALRVAALIFAITLALGIAFHVAGEDATSRLLMSGNRFQPVVAALFGLIPNCAVSVLLAKLYLGGALSFGAVVAGLGTGAGMGSLVLVQSCRSRREAILLLAILFAVGSAAGLVLDCFGPIP